jgi:DNA-binding NtrC family response regulator
VSWRSTVRDVRASTWKQALEAAHGNITHAAEALKIHRTHGAKLTKQYGLTGYALELRLGAGVPATGRPPNRARKKEA